ncbi:MAG: hypothetical protein V3U46_07320 [Acidimicrobiia bacterium]
MPDTVRTVAALQGLLADNAAGDISAQDVRDVLVSAFPYVWRPSSAGDYDDLFDADSEADWTAVAPDSGSAAWAYDYLTRVGLGRGVHLAFEDADGTDVTAYVKSVAGIATGDYIQTAIDFALLDASGSSPGVGPIFTDGVTSAADFALGGLLSSSDALAWWGADGTLGATNAGTFTQNINTVGLIHIRLLYSAANTFQLLASLNGEDFSQVGSDIAHVFTPTHAGFGAYLSNPTTPQFAHFQYFHSNIVAP